MNREIVIDRLKKVTERRHPGRPYTIHEYAKFYTVVVDGTQPFLFEKNDGFPINLTFAQINKEECNNPKLVYTSGGKDNGKK